MIMLALGLIAIIILQTILDAFMPRKVQWLVMIALVFATIIYLGSAS